MLTIVGIDPGFASGGCARLIDGIFASIEAMPKTHEPELFDRVDTATHWFCQRIAGANLVAIENQHGSAHGQSRAHQSNATTIWVREVVGGIRRSCYRRGIPIRLIDPQEWRTRLGLPRTASKGQAWQSVCATHPSALDARTNEHSRDAAVIARVGSISAHWWLVTWREMHSGVA